MTFIQARDVELTIREYNDKILTLVDEIRDFLEADKHTDPANILVVAKDVMKIKLPNEDEINELKRKMKNLGIEKPSDSGDSNGPGYGEVTAVAKEASEVLKRAQALAKQVQTAIDNYDDAKESCESAEKFNEDAQAAKEQTTEVISDVVLKIQNLSSELDQLQ